MTLQSLVTSTDQVVQQLHGGAVTSASLQGFLRYGRLVTSGNREV